MADIYYKKNDEYFCPRCVKGKRGYERLTLSDIADEVDGANCSRCFEVILDEPDIEYCYICGSEIDFDEIISPPFQGQGCQRCEEDTEDNIGDYND